MRKASTGCWSRGFKRHPLLQTSSPLNINRELTLGLGQQTGALQIRQPRVSCSCNLDDFDRISVRGKGCQVNISVTLAYR